MDRPGNVCFCHSVEWGEVLGSFVLLQSLPMFRGYFDGYISTTHGRRNGTIWLAVVCGGLGDSRRQRGQTWTSSFAERSCSTSRVYIECTGVGYIKTGGYLHAHQNPLHRPTDSFVAIRTSITGTRSSRPRIDTMLGSVRPRWMMTTRCNGPMRCSCSRKRTVSVPSQLFGRETTQKREDFQPEGFDKAESRARW